jgi:hypothetical protein
MCGGGGGILAPVIGAVKGPVDTLVNAGTKLVTDPTKLNLGDAVSLAAPIAGSVAVDQVKNPSHAAVDAVALGGAYALAPAAAAAAPAAAAGSAATPSTSALIAADFGGEFGGTSAGVTLAGAAAPSAAAAAAGGGGGSSLLTTLGISSLVSSLQGAGHAAFPSFIPAPSNLSVLPQVNASRDASGLLGYTPNVVPQGDSAPAPVLAAVGGTSSIAALIIPGGVVIAVAWWVYKHYFRKRK